MRNGQACRGTAANSGGARALILEKRARRARQGRQRVSSLRRPEAEAAEVVEARGGGVLSVPGGEQGIGGDNKGWGDKVVRIR